MRLEIAAGENPRPGYIHHDIRELPDIEIVCEAREITEHVETRSCEEVCAAHILEHFSYHETKDILKDWVSLLKKGGLLHIEVPNISWQASAFCDGKIDDKEYIYYVFGEQDHKYNFHYAGFTSRILRELFNEVSLKNINIMDIGQVLIAEGMR